MPDFDERVHRGQIMSIAVKIWPYISKAITTSFYFLINLIKVSVKSALDQIKGL